MTADILTEIKDKIGTITLNRPDRLNAWTDTMGQEVKETLLDWSDNDDVRVIIVTGAGRGFCAGADMGGLQAIQGGTRDRSKTQTPKEAGKEATTHDLGEGLDVKGNYVGRFGYMLDVKKPIIAAINGPCAGIGLVFALYADIRFAATNAKFTTAFAQRGLIAEHGISWLLPRLIGNARALDMLMTARKFTGDEAAMMGLVNQAYAPELFENAVADYARILADTVSPRSVAIMKAQIYNSHFQGFNESVEIADREMVKSFDSEDFKEGVAHFVEKREANFTGR